MTNLDESNSFTCKGTKNINMTESLWIKMTVPLQIYNHSV